MTLHTCLYMMPTQTAQHYVRLSVHTWPLACQACTYICMGRSARFADCLYKSAMLHKMGHCCTQHQPHMLASIFDLDWHDSVQQAVSSQLPVLAHCRVLYDRRWKLHGLQHLMSDHCCQAADREYAIQCCDTPLLQSLLGVIVLQSALEANDRSMRTPTTRPEGCAAAKPLLCSKIVH